MTDKIGGLIERLRVQGVWSTGLPPHMAIEAAEALSALRAQRDEVIEECARVCHNVADIIGALPGSSIDSALSEAATAIRNLKSQEEQG